MNSGGDASRRQTRYVRNLRRAFAFEIEKNNLAIEWFQPMDQRLQFRQFFAPPLLRRAGPRRWIDRQRIQFHPTLRSLAPPRQMIGPDVVRHTINPCPQTAALVESLQAAPQLDVDLLQQVALPVRIALIASNQTPHGLAMLRLRLRIKPILIAWTQSWPLTL